MGINDRDYNRRPRPSEPRPPLTSLSFNTILIIANIAIYLIDPLLQGARRAVTIGLQLAPGLDPRALTISGPPTPLPPVGTAFNRPIFNPQTLELLGQQTDQVMTPLQALGHFSTATSFVHFTGGHTFFGLEVWRFITFQFLHGSLSHIILNMLGLWVFGSLVEEQLGKKRYAAFYLACGMAGAALYLALNFMGSQLGIRIPGVLTGDPHTPLVGASAGVFGVIIAAAKIAPREKIQLLIPPIPLQIRFLAAGYFLIALGNLLIGGSNQGGDAAHVGGAIAGFLLIRNAHVLREFFDVLGPSEDAPPAPATAPSTTSAEVDRILAKVKATGLNSLTDEERNILHQETDRKRST